MNSKQQEEKRSLINNDRRVEYTFDVTTPEQEIFLPCPMYAHGLTLLREDTPILVSGTTVCVGSKEKVWDTLGITDFDSNCDTLIDRLIVKYSDEEIGEGFVLTVVGNLLDSTKVKSSSTELLTNLLDELSLILKIKTGEESFSKILGSYSSKPLDRTGFADSNKVENEAHFVNVPSGRCNVITASGDFYTHDLTIRHETKQLERGVDYEFASFQLLKSVDNLYQRSVYRRIVIKAPIVGRIFVSYRAVGGRAPSTFSSYIKLSNTISDLVEEMLPKNILTTKNAHTSPAFLGLENRIRVLESLSKMFPSGTYTYECEKNGMNWFTLGEFGWDTKHSNTKEQYYVDFKFPEEQQEFKTVLSVDLTKGDRALEVFTLSSTTPNVEKRMCDVPKLRVIWKGDPTNPNTFFGSLLQIGKFVTSEQSFSVTVTNRSYDDKKLTFWDPEKTPKEPQMETIPVSYTVWKKDGLNCYSSEYPIAPSDGVVLWSGSIPLNEATHSSIDLPTLWCKELFAVDQIKAVKLFFKDHRGETISFLKDHSHGGEFLAGSIQKQDEAGSCMLRYMINSCEKTGIILTIDSCFESEEELSPLMSLEKIVVRF